MANLSKIKREKMLDYLEKLKELNNDNENIRAIAEIENALNEKKYGLVWEEYSEKVDEELIHSIPIFVEDENRKITVNDEPYNFLLEGDNLHSLKLLEKTHKGKIDVIYIDPPYNTGNKDFIYDDSFVDKTDGYAHSKWLSFMEKRLNIARELLSDDGVIFISIDENGRCFWDTFARPGLKNPIVYDIIAPDGSKIHNGWIRSEERFLREYSEGKIRITKKKNGEWSVQFKQYLNVNGKTPRSMTMDFGGTMEGDSELKTIFGKKSF